MSGIIKDKNKSFDHRDINKKLEIFFVSERIGQGLPILLKNGTKIKNLIQDFIRKKEREYGCEEVNSPILADPLLYKKSGHLEHYKEYIFPKIEKDNESFQIRPMTCPHHCIIYSRKINSYKDLPIWISEHSILHRFESSGSLKGLERARWMELSDNHIFTTFNLLKGSFKKCFSFICEIISFFGIKINRFVCSLHKEDDKKYHDDEEIWKISESILIESLEELGVEFVKEEGEAAFYGPKLDIEVANTDGKNITVSTIQIDFILPRKFSLYYIDKNGLKEPPVIIHHSSIGTYQRFISIILEQHEGKLPVWLSPIQIVLLPMLDKKGINKDKIIKFCDDLKNDLSKKGVRVEAWGDKKRLSYKIKKIFDLNIPLYSVIGEKEFISKMLVVHKTYNKCNEEVKIEDLKDFIWNYPKD